MQHPILTPEGFEAAQRETLESQIQVYPMRSWYASAVGMPCDRHLVWRWTRWQEATPHSYVLQSIFNEGRLHQPDVEARLIAMGFDLVREPERPTQWILRNGAVVSGRYDAKLRSFRGEAFEPRPIAEVKSAQDHIWQRLNTAADLMQSDHHYIRGYVDQQQMYMMLESVPVAVMILKSKGTGLLKLIPFTLDLDRAEHTVSRIERLHEMVQQKVDPMPIPYDERICGGCGFRKVCYPPVDMGKGLQLLEDAQLLEDMQRREELKESSKEYDALDKAVKSRLKRLGTFEMAAIGPYVIIRKEVPVKAYSVKERVDVRFEIENALAKKPVVQGMPKREIE